MMKSSPREREKTISFKSTRDRQTSTTPTASKYQEICQYLKGGEEELNQLIHSVTFFKKGDDKILQRKYYKKIKNNLTYHFIPKNTFLFHHESRSDYFYIILKGKCQVLIPKTQNEIKLQELCQIEIQNCQSQINKFVKDDDEYRTGIQQQKMIVLQKKIEELHSEPLNQIIKEQSKALQDIYFSLSNKEINRYKIVLMLSSGDYFGESAFSTVPKRNGAILVTEDTHFARLKREDFLRIYENEIINQSVSKQYLTKIFSHLNTIKIDHLNSYIEEVQIIKGQIVFNYGQKNDGFLYFVNTGSFEITYNLSSTQAIIKNVQDSLIEQQLFKYNKQQHIRILTLTGGEIFGIEDINRETKSFSVICSSAKGSIFRFRQAIISQIEDDESLKRIKMLGEQRYERIQQKIKQAFQQREEQIAIEKLQNLNMPLVSTQNKILGERYKNRSFSQASPQNIMIGQNSIGLNVNKSSLQKSNLNQLSTSSSHNKLQQYSTLDELFQPLDNICCQKPKFDVFMKQRGQKRRSIRRESSLKTKTQPDLSEHVKDSTLTQANDLDDNISNNKSFFIQNSSYKNTFENNGFKSQSPFRKEMSSEKDISENSILKKQFKLYRPKTFSRQYSPIKATHPLQQQQYNFDENNSEKQKSLQQTLHEKLNIKPLHKNHFSIFTQEQFNDMCTKSDIRPSLNPMMIKKKIKQEIESKSIYRDINKYKIIRASSSHSKDHLNRTPLSQKNEMNKTSNSSYKTDHKKTKQFYSSLSQMLENSPEYIKVNEQRLINNFRPKSRIQTQHYQLTDKSIKNKLQNFDFPILLSSQVKSNYLNVNMHPQSNNQNLIPRIQTSNYSPTKPPKSANQFLFDL